MPLNQHDRENVLRYCDQDLPDEGVVNGFFNFITDDALRTVIVKEFMAARYIYKLGEALFVDDQKLHAHTKFQIVQYAAIYEAVIVYLLWEKFPDRSELDDIEYHEVYSKSTSWPNDIVVQDLNGSEVFLCSKVRKKTSRPSIKFDDKVDAAIKIGFVDKSIGDEIKTFFKIRNGVHIENAVKNDIEYELDNARLAYRRMRPFTLGIKGFLKDGVLPLDARPKCE